MGLKQKGEPQMYELYVNDTLTGIMDDLEALKNIGFILAVKGHKVAYIRMV